MREIVRDAIKEAIPSFVGNGMTLIKDKYGSGPACRVPAGANRSTGTDGRCNAALRREWEQE